MGALIPVCLAELFFVKAVALLVLGFVAYLYWTGIREKRAQRRQRQWLEDRRRELKEKAARNVEPPHAR